MNLTELEKKLIRKRIVVLSERILEAEARAANYFANLQQQRRNMEDFEEHYNYTQDVIQRFREERLELLRELNQVEPGADEETPAMGLADGDTF